MQALGQGQEGLEPGFSGTSPADSAEPSSRGTLIMAQLQATVSLPAWLQVRGNMKVIDLRKETAPGSFHANRATSWERADSKAGGRQTPGAAQESPRGAGLSHVSRAGREHQNAAGAPGHPGAPAIFPVPGLWYTPVWMLFIILFLRPVVLSRWNISSRIENTHSLAGKPRENMLRNMPCNVRNGHQMSVWLQPHFITISFPSPAAA